MESGPELVRRYRKDRGLSQADLAYAIREAEIADGMPSRAGTSYVSQIERDINTPSRQRALLIDQILGANGEVAHAFGYRVAPSDDFTPPAVETQWTPLERHEELARRLDDLILQVQVMGDAIARLERGGRRDAR